MKLKRIITILSTMSIIINTSPVMGDELIKSTDIAVQDTQMNLTAGVSKLLVNAMNHPMSNRVHTGYLISNVNVRSQATTNSDIYDVYDFNQKIEYQSFNDEWVEIQYEGKIAYINSEYISDTKCKYMDYIVPITSGFKSYMPYTAITSKNSAQYKLQKIAYTGTYGIRQYDGRYLVAIGTAFNAKVGTYFDLILNNGTIIECVVGDVKADKDTCSRNMITRANGCLTEFIVSNNDLDRNARKMGDISYCNSNWQSRVKKIRVYNKSVKL